MFFEEGTGGEGEEEGGVAFFVAGAGVNFLHGRECWLGGWAEEFEGATGAEGDGPVGVFEFCDEGLEGGVTIFFVMGEPAGGGDADFGVWVFEEFWASKFG